MSDELFTTTTVEQEADGFWGAVTFLLWLVVLILALCPPAIVAGVWRWGL